MDSLKHIKLPYYNKLFILFLGAFLNAPKLVYSQENLVLNPSFEDLSCFPQSHYDFYCVNDWWNVNNNSIDVWHRYASIGNDFFTNGLGPQNTQWGDVYTSIAISYRWFSLSPPYYPPVFKVPEVYGYSNFDIIEVLGGTFKKTLEANKIYFYEFYVNVPDNLYVPDNPDESYLITNSLDLYTLFDDTLNLQDPSSYNNYGNRIFKNQTIFKDTVNWIQISGCFKARGGEKYFAVGPIRDTTEIQFEEYISWGNDIVVSSGIYLDNFSVYECDTCCLEEFPYEDHITISNNPGNSTSPTTFSILINPNSTAILEIYDSAGRLIARNEYSELLNNYTLPSLANGVYHYSFSSSNGVKVIGKVLVVE